MILDSTYFDEIFVLLHYEVVGLLRIQSITFYIVLNITTYVELQYIRSQIIRILILPYWLSNLDVRKNRHVFEWSMRLSQKVKDLLRLLSWFTYVNLKIKFKHGLQDFLLSSHKLFLLLILMCVHVIFYVIFILCLKHDVLQVNYLILAEAWR